MHRHMLLAGITLLTTVVVSGCAGSRQAEMGESDKAYGAPTSIYSVMDSTSLVYSDPAAASPVSDSPFRWIGFLLHPIGQALDYGLNRPVYAIGNNAPYLFGYTSEDSMLDTQRR